MCGSGWPDDVRCPTRLAIRSARAPNAAPNARNCQMDAIADATKVKRLTHRETLLIVLGMLLPIFMGSLDQTILASALPTIGRDLRDAHDLPWLITAYLLASTAVIPLYGKIADIHGRAFALRIAIALHLAGSLVCALAPSLPVLILGRGLQGIGGGGLASMGMVVLGDVAAPRERGRYYAYFAVTYTTAGACGPALGGFLADHLHWSAIFWLNVPLALAALVVTATLLRGLPRYERPHRLDVPGVVLIVAASVSCMLGLNLAGSRLPWTSLPVLMLFAAALIVGALFVLRLFTAREPLIPISVLRDPVVRCAVVANAFGWGSIVALNIFLPSYLQSVIGLSATDAGLSLMVLMVTLNVSAGLTSQLLCRVTRYKRLPMAGLAIAIAALLILAWRAESLDLTWFELLLILIGAGFGPLPSLTQVAVQNCVARHQLGISMGAMNFSRNLLATILVAAFGAIVLGGAAAVDQGPTPAAVTAVWQHGAAAQAFARVFYADAACIAIALIAVVLMAERPLQE
jgi:MFS family permease